MAIYVLLQSHMTVANAPSFLESSRCSFATLKKISCIAKYDDVSSGR